MCLSKYPEYFKEEGISLYKYKWVYILTTNRCFGSNWPGVCAMIPYAELINHENVDVQYDYLDLEGNSIVDRRAEKVKTEKEERLIQILKKNVFLEELKKDLINLETEFKQKVNDSKKDTDDFTI